MMTMKDHCVTIKSCAHLPISSDIILYEQQNNYTSEPSTEMLKKLVVVLALLAIGGRVLAQQQLVEKNVTNGAKDCVSREEFDTLQRELHYWQNTTINILKKYLIDNEEDQSSHCSVSDDSYLKDKVEELDQKVEGILNQTQGLGTDISSVNDKLEGLEDQFSHPVLGSFLNPAPSCKLIPQGSSSGHYWIQNSGTGYANLEYCDMTRRCCNSTGGWMRVVHLNITDTNQQCPSGFRLVTSPKRTCGTPGSRCVSTTFPLNGVKYSRVCGKIKAYQYGSPDAFAAYYGYRGFTIDDRYFEGVSLTHGQRPRKHIWTFAAGADESNFNQYHCPCNTQYTGVVPPFIAQDYFCDTGSTYRWSHQFYYADPLWDGSGCGPNSNCCGFNNPPWFCKQLPQPTTDDIEMRVCIDEAISNEDIALETVQIFVQ